MKVLILLGSRNPDGQTARAANEIRKGIEAANGQAETVLLPILKIERCRQCEDNGWGLCRTEGRCVIPDDLAGVAEKVRAADALVLATPVYYSDLSESLRAFMDRLRRTGTHPTGHKDLEGKKAVGICVAGGGGGGAPACCVSLERIMATCGFDVLDTIPVRRQNLVSKLPALQQVGSNLVR